MFSIQTKRGRIWGTVAAVDHITDKLDIIEFLAQSGVAVRIIFTEQPKGKSDGKTS